MSQASLKKIILCADDFGYNETISTSILQLVAAGRLSAVSCMSNRPNFLSQATALEPYQDTIQCGLHFNLTDGYLLAQPKHPGFSLGRILLKSHLGLLNKQLIKDEFNAQLDNFIQYMGRLPDFIDGHQHVHQLPTIRNAVVEVYKQRLAIRAPYIRATSPAAILPAFRFKACVLALTGGLAFAKRLQKEQIAHNTYFAGMYNFAPKTDYRALFCAWLAKAQNNTLIMCHPAKQATADDTISIARTKEFAYLSSDEFTADCLEHGIIL